MKKIIAFVFLLFITSTFNAQENKKLNNSKIIELSNTGYSKPMLLKVVEEADHFQFDTSLEGLKNLSENNIDDDIVMAIMEKQDEYRKEQGESIQIENVDFTTKEYGLFYIKNNQKVEVTPNYSEGKLRSGIASIVWRASIDNRTSSNIIPSDVKELYINFDPSTDVADKSLTDTEEYMEEAILFNMKRKRNRREIEVGRSGMSASKTKVKSRDIIDFKYEKIKGDFYKIIISEALKSGDYGFIFGGIKTGAGTSMKIYDFTIE